MTLARSIGINVVPPLAGPDRAGLPWEAVGGGVARDACIGTALVADLDIASPTTESYSCAVIIPDGLRVTCADGATLSISKVS